MALARVVTFEDVSSDRMKEMSQQIEGSDPPEGFPESSEIIVLHDAAAEKALVVIILDNEDDYNQADEVLSAMPAEDTPGRRSSVTKCNVAVRMKS